MDDEEQFLRAKSDPDTRKAFQALRGEYKNSWNLCIHLFQDRDLQRKIRLITMALNPLENEFYRDIESQQKGQEHMARWAAQRAARGWRQCISETLQLLHDENFFKRLGLMRYPGKVLGEEQREEAWVKEELHWAELAYNLCVDIAAARAWSQVMFSTLLPQVLAILLHDSAQAKQGGLAFMRRVATTILEAEKKTHIPGIRKCLNDIAFHKTQLVRELFQLGIDPGQKTNSF